MLSPIARTRLNGKIREGFTEVKSELWTKKGTEERARGLAKLEPRGVSVAEVGKGCA